MAPASAPAGTVAVIQEYKAKGNLSKALYAVVGFDDGLAIVIFGFAAAIARNILVAESGAADNHFLSVLWMPVREVGLSLVIGGAAGFVFCWIVRRLKESRDILIVTFGMVLI
ncbi:MAG: cation:proton antiporter, partial [Planctomycetota bacterium]